MLARFAKVFDLTGYQLLVQRRQLPIPCTKCGQSRCNGTTLINVLTLTTVIPESGIDLLLAMPAPQDTPGSAQQMLDAFDVADAREALSILQANHYEVDTHQESETRLAALTTSFFTRLSAQQ